MSPQTGAAQRRPAPSRRPPWGRGTGDGALPGRRTDTAGQRLSHTLAEIQRRAPKAQIYVVGPAILPADGTSCDDDMAIAPGDLTYLHTKQQQLNTMLRKQADTTGAQYVDTYQPSLGRDACSPRETRWIEPLIPQAPAAVQRLTRAALPHMVAGRRRLDRLTASVASVRGSAAGAAYTTAKHGIVGLPKSLAVMYRGQGIRANAIAAGATATNIQVDRRPKAYGPGLIGPYTGLCGKVADTEEQAAAIVFRASDAARCVNGAILPVDHGWHAI